MHFEAIQKCQCLHESTKHTLLGGDMCLRLNDVDCNTLSFSFSFFKQDRLHLLYLYPLVFSGTMTQKYNADSILNYSNNQHVLCNLRL